MTKRINHLISELDTRRAKVEKELGELEIICQEIINLKEILDNNDKQDNGQ
jgi:DNA anti-recombination protein RmuC